MCTPVLWPYICLVSARALTSLYRQYRRRQNHCQRPVSEPIRSPENETLTHSPGKGQAFNKDWAVRCCRRCGIAGRERVPPAPIGRYSMMWLVRTSVSGSGSGDVCTVCTDWYLPWLITREMYSHCTGVHTDTPGVPPSCGGTRNFAFSRWVIRSLHFAQSWTQHSH